MGVAIRRGAVLRFLGSCGSYEVGEFIKLILVPFQNLLGKWEGLFKDTCMLCVNVVCVCVHVHVSVYTDMTVCVCTRTCT